MKIKAIYKDKSLWIGDSAEWSKAPNNIIAMRIIYDDDNSLLVYGENNIVLKEDDQFLFVYLWTEEESKAQTLLIDKKTLEQTYFKGSKPNAELNAYESKEGDLTAHVEKDQYQPYIEILLQDTKDEESNSDEIKI